MKKSKLYFILLIVIIIFSGVYFYMIRNNTKEEKSLPVDVVDKSMSPIENKDKILGNKDDLVSFSIWPDTKVHGVVSYSGVIKGAYFFEANILINILDVNKNVLKSSNAVATTDWMTAESVDFEGNIDFTGLPTGSAYFEIHNDNASGLPEHDKSILIPIVIE